MSDIGENGGSNKMLTLVELPHYTYEERKNWSDHWELMEGIPYAMKPAPTLSHQHTNQKIARFLDEALGACPLCRALLPVNWVICEDTAVQPNNSVICHESKGKHLTKAPSLIFEILLPASAQEDRTTRFALYEKEGVTYCCMVDVENCITKIFRLKDGRYVKQLDAGEETHEFDLGKCRFSLDFSRIWLWYGFWIQLTRVNYNNPTITIG